MMAARVSPQTPPPGGQLAHLRKLSAPPRVYFQFFLEVCVCEVHREGGEEKKRAAKTYKSSKVMITLALTP